MPYAAALLLVLVGGSIFLVAGHLPDGRTWESLANSIVLGLVTAGGLMAWGAAAAVVFYFCGVPSVSILVGLFAIPLLIPDFSFGVMVRALVVQRGAPLASPLLLDLWLNRYALLILVGLSAAWKWAPLAAAGVGIWLTREPAVLRQSRLDFSTHTLAVRAFVLPYMSSLLLALAVLGFLIGFRQHELAQEISAGGVGFNTETWSHWNYRVLFEFADTGRGLAESVIVLLIFAPVLELGRRLLTRGTR